ncbi:hypothetical protein Gotur_023613 [Gossypium turneri]
MNTSVLGPYISNIATMTVYLRASRLAHVPRIVNRVAHQLASVGLRDVGSIYRVGVEPTFLSTTVAFDRAVSGSGVSWTLSAGTRASVCMFPLFLDLVAASLCFAIVGFPNLSCSR